MIHEPFQNFLGVAGCYTQFPITPIFRLIRTSLRWFHPFFVAQRGGCALATMARAAPWYQPWYRGWQHGRDDRKWRRTLFRVEGWSRWIRWSGNGACQLENTTDVCITMFGGLKYGENQDPAIILRYSKFLEKTSIVGRIASPLLFEI